MLDLSILKENPELAKSLKLEVSGADLLAFGEAIHKLALAEKVKENEEFLTGKELAKLLGVSEVTLWSWDKKGITHPLRIGKQKRYRKSDVEKILEEN
jgi:predicted DNA-binding transcriptional regulator AlpA